jgi:hypothetical protein
MRILLRRTSDYELRLNSDNKDIDGFNYYDDIVDTLTDETADQEEKTRTIVAIMESEFMTGSPYKEVHEVFVFNDAGQMIFTGDL